MGSVKLLKSPKIRAAKGDKKRAKWLAVSVLAIPTVIPLMSSGASTDTWAGNTSASWSVLDGFNVVPASGDSLLFNAAGSAGTVLNDDLTSSSFAISGLTFSSTASAYTINGNSLQLTGGITNSSTTAAQQINNNILLNGTQTINVAAPAPGTVAVTGLTLGGIIDSGGSAYGITKAGTGALAFTTANTYSGPTAINNGIVILNNGALGSSAVTVGLAGTLSTEITTAFTTPTSSTMGGLTLNLTGAPTSPVQRTASLVYGGGFTTGTSNNATNTGGNFTVNGIASNTTSNFGPLTLNPGMMKGIITAVGGGYTRVIFDSVTRNPGSQLDFTRGTNVGQQNISAQSAGATVVFTAAPTLIGGAGAAGSPTVSVLPWAFVNLNLATYDPAKGLRALVQANNEEPALTSSLSSNSNASVIANTSLGGSVAVNALAVLGTTTAVTITVGNNNALTVGSGAIIGPSRAAAAIGASANDGILAFGSAEGNIHQPSGQVLTINSAITGTNGITFGLDQNTSAATGVVLAGTNSFSGATRVTGNNPSMTVRLTNSLALQNSTLDYNNYGASVAFGNGTSTGQSAYTFGGLSGAQDLALVNNNSTPGAVALTIGSSGDTDTATTINTYSGVLSGSVGTGGSVIINGPATHVFSAANTYTGGTTITLGRLRLSNTAGSATGTAAVAVSGGTNATLAGTGSAQGTVTVTNNSRLAPGNNLAGTNFGTSGQLSLGTTGGLTLTAGNLDLDLSNSSAGSNDLITTGGALSLISVTVNINESSGALATGVAYTVISGASSVTSGVTPFAGIGSASFATTFANGPAYTATYGLSGNDLTVSFSTVPEPASLGLVGFGALSLLRRRRRSVGR